jgi:trans-aconitate methyltransferase
MHDTIATYNKAAKAYAEKFNGIGSRESDVASAVLLWGGARRPKVVEWGCGNGRDAAVILRYADSYVGIDASEEMISLARAQVPEAMFKVADMNTFIIPEDTDVVFAFASLLHCSRDQMRALLQATHQRLQKDGLIYVSLKRGAYEERIVTDQYGPRTFYFYDEEDMHSLTEGLYAVTHYTAHVHNGIDWLTCALKKI